MESASGALSGIPLLTEHVVISWFCVSVMFLAPDDCIGCIGVSFSIWSPTAGNSGIFLPPRYPLSGGPIRINGGGLKYNNNSNISRYVP
jgi:hypothetical protein